MQFKIGNGAQIRECLLIKPPSETFKYSCKSFSFNVAKEAASNRGVYFRGDEVLFILLYAQQGVSSVQFFIVYGISPPIQQRLRRYTVKTLLSSLFAIMEINPYMAFNLFAWINNMPLIRLTKGAVAEHCCRFMQLLAQERLILLIN